MTMDTITNLNLVPMVVEQTARGERSYDIALITKHASWEGLDAYQVHPVHQGVGVHMQQVVERSVAVDYES